MQVAKQFSKFIFVGLFSTAVNYLCFWLLLDFLHINYQLAFVSGYMTGVLAGFTLTKQWTCKANGKTKGEIFKYCGVYIVSLILGGLFLRSLVEGLSLDPKIANIIVIGFTTVTNFAGIKFLVFKK